MLANKFMYGSLILTNPYKLSHLQFEITSCGLEWEQIFKPLNNDNDNDNEIIFIVK